MIIDIQNNYFLSVLDNSWIIDDPKKSYEMWLIK